MEPIKIFDTNTSYFYEKLGLKKETALKAIDLWNKSLEKEIEEIDLHKIFTIKKCPIGLHVMENNKILVLCKSIRDIENPHAINYRGIGGYI